MITLTYDDVKFIEENVAKIISELEKEDEDSRDASIKLLSAVSDAIGLEVYRRKRDTAIFCRFWADHLGVDISDINKIYEQGREQFDRINKHLLENNTLISERNIKV